MFGTAFRTVRARKEAVMSRVALASGVVVEELGGDLMVMVPGSTEVLTLSDVAADAVRRVQSGSPVATDAVVSDLVRLGVLETSGLSRRGLIKAGAIGAGAGIAVMAMPNAAMAASGGDGGPSEFDLGNSGVSGSSGNWSFSTNVIPGTGFPSGVPDGYSGTFTTNSGIVIAVTYNSSTDSWSGLSDSQESDDTKFWYGVLTFSFGGRDYLGTAS
jgi:hypothetical protein